MVMRREKFTNLDRQNKLFVKLGPYKIIKIATPGSYYLKIMNAQVYIALLMSNT